MKRTIPTLLSVLALAVPCFAQGDARLVVSKALGADYDRESAVFIVEEAAKIDAGTKDMVSGITTAFMAFYGNEDLVKPALTMTEGLRGTSLGAAIYASCKATKGKYALLAFRKNPDPTLTAVASAAVVDSSALLDKAVASNPDDIFTRFIRLLVDVEVARLSPFDLDKDSLADCQFLLAELPKQSGLAPAFRAQCWYYIAEYYALSKKINKSYGYYEKALREAPGSRTSANATKRLEELEG